MSVEGDMVSIWEIFGEQIKLKCLKLQGKIIYTF